MHVAAFPRAPELRYRRELFGSLRIVRTLLDERLAPILVRYTEALALPPGAGRTAALRVQRARVVASVDALKNAVGPALPKAAILGAIGEQAATATEREVRRALIAEGIDPAPIVTMRADAAWGGMRFDALATVETLPDGRKRYTSTSGAVYIEPKPKAGTKTRASEEEVHARFLRTKQLETWARENLKLVQSLPEQYLNAVSSQVRKAMDQERPAEYLAQILEERYGVARSRAKLIATDQIGSLDAKITEAVQRAAGVAEYIWQTMEDEKVRPMHGALNQSKQSWDAPPVTNKNGDRNHPGQDIRCRCRSRPLKSANPHGTMSDADIVEAVRATKAAERRSRSR